MRITTVLGDITQQHVDAIVNAANSSLLGGGGVDGAIHRRGGSAILAECRALRASHYGKRLNVGLAVATTAGNLPARWVIHTVGPVFSAGRRTRAGRQFLLRHGHDPAGRQRDRVLLPKPGSTFVFGFSISNTGAHDVTVQSIDEIIGMADQKITFDPETNGGSDGPGASTQTLPLTIHPGQSRGLYLAMHLSTDIVDAGRGESYFDSLILHVRSLGVDRVQEFPLGDDLHPLWIGISGIDDHGKACDRTQQPILD